MKDIQLLHITQHPGYAERLILSDYVKHRPDIPSRFIQGLMITNPEEDFCCPQCKKVSTFNWENNQGIYECSRCGLKRQSAGNALYIWK